MLECTAENRADCILATCPMCWVNREACQQQVNRMFGASHQMPVLYLTQLLGLALGCSEEELGLGRNLIPLKVTLPAAA